MARFDDVKVGFIGFGNMAQAIARGFLRADAVPARMLENLLNASSGFCFV